MQITAGDHHVFAPSADVKIYSWGLNFDADLGTGSATQAGVVTPSPISTGAILSGAAIRQLAVRSLRQRGADPAEITRCAAAVIAGGG